MTRVTKENTMSRQKTHPGKRHPRDKDGCKSWNEESINQGKPKMSSNCQKPEHKILQNVSTLLES